MVETTWMFMVCAKWKARIRAPADCKGKGETLAMVLVTAEEQLRRRDIDRSLASPTLPKSSSLDRRSSKRALEICDWDAEA